MGIQVRKRIIINIPFIGIKMAQILRAEGGEGIWRYAQYNPSGELVWE